MARGADSLCSPVIRLFHECTERFFRSLKAERVDYRRYETSHLVYEGVMKGKEKTFSQYRTAPDDDIYSKIGKAFSQAMGESMTVTDPYHATQSRIVKARGLPDLKGKEFFGKR